MKRFGLALLLTMLAIGITACTKDKDNAGNTQNGGTAIQQPQENNENGDGMGTDGESDSVNDGMDNSSDNMMDVSAGWSEEMTRLRDAVADALGDNYWPNTQIVPEMLEGVYGVTPDMYDDYMGESPMISVNVDTLLIIKAKDDKVEAVEKALDSYRDRMVNDTMQYPMNLGKIQASRIHRYGNYVCFVQLGADISEVEDSGEEAIIAYCQDQNELALEVIAQNVSDE